MVGESRKELSDGVVLEDADKGSDKDTSDLEMRRYHLEESLMRKGALIVPGKQKQAEGLSKASAGQAVKLSSEFLAAVVVGVCLGIGLDQLTGWSPWGLVTFLMLGFMAGVLNILRTVGAVRSPYNGQDDKGRESDN